MSKPVTLNKYGIEVPDKTEYDFDILVGNFITGTEYGWIYPLEIKGPYLLQRTDESLRMLALRYEGAILINESKHYLAPEPYLVILLTEILWHQHPRTLAIKTDLHKFNEILNPFRQYEYMAAHAAEYAKYELARLEKIKDSLNITDWPRQTVKDRQERFAAQVELCITAYEFYQEQRKARDREVIKAVYGILSPLNNLDIPNILSYYNEIIRLLSKTSDTVLFLEELAQNRQRSPA